MADSLADAMKRAQTEAAAQTVVTRLDAAWVASAEAPEDDAAAARFIDVLLAEPLFCPVWSSEPDNEPAADDVQPKMVEIDGADTLLLFDSEDRLAAYVEEPTDFVALPGRAFFTMVAGQSVQFALNLNVAPSSTVLPVEAVASIAEFVGSNDDVLSVDGDFEVQTPADLPEDLLGALGGRLLAASDLVEQAWLVAANTPAGPSLILAMTPPQEGVDPDRLQALTEELGQLGGSLLEGDALDIAVCMPEDPIVRRIAQVGLRLDAARH
ncbi:MAG: SseB family protein [Pseudomonadota bacterium]